MKTLLLSTALLGASALSAAAQDQFLAASDPMALRATDLMGQRIYASAAADDAASYAGLQEGWEDIGEVGDVILSREGQVEAVIVDIGGFLGMGEREVAVSMGSLRFVADDATPEDLGDYFIVVNADRAVLEAAPAYQDASEVAAADPAAGTGGAMATDGMAVDGMAADGMATEGMAAEGGAMTAEAPDSTLDGMATGDAMATDSTAAADDTGAGGALREPVTREGFALADPAMLTTDMLTGAVVYDANDERVGDVGELVLTAEGQVTDAIVDVGGFLGIGEKPVALPMSDLDILNAVEGGELRVYVAQTREELEALPTYEYQN